MSVKRASPVRVVGILQWLHLCQVFGDSLTEGKGTILWEFATDRLQTQYHRRSISSKEREL